MCIRDQPAAVDGARHRGQVLPQPDDTEQGTNYPEGDEAGPDHEAGRPPRVAPRGAKQPGKAHADEEDALERDPALAARPERRKPPAVHGAQACLLYTSDAADDLLCVDL